MFVGSGGPRRTYGRISDAICVRKYYVSITRARKKNKNKTKKDEITTRESGRAIRSKSAGVGRRAGRVHKTCAVRSVTLSSPPPRARPCNPNGLARDPDRRRGRYPRGRTGCRQTRRATRLIGGGATWQRRPCSRPAPRLPPGGTEVRARKSVRESRPPFDHGRTRWGARGSK